MSFVSSHRCDLRAKLALKLHPVVDVVPDVLGANDLFRRAAILHPFNQRKNHIVFGVGLEGLPDAALPDGPLARSAKVCGGVPPAQWLSGEQSQ